MNTGLQFDERMARLAESAHKTDKTGGNGNHILAIRGEDRLAHQVGVAHEALEFLARGSIAGNVSGPQTARPKPELLGQHPYPWFRALLIVS
jgi:hypothetical protein